MCLYVFIFKYGIEGDYSKNSLSGAKLLGTLPYHANTRFDNGLKIIIIIIIINMSDN